MPYRFFCQLSALVLLTWGVASAALAVVPIISAGGNHSFALKADGSLWAWGHNWYGQLGDGSTRDASFPKLIGNDFVSISAGWDKTVAIKSDGSLWIWGSNYYGNEYFNVQESSSTPIQLGNGFTAISAGGVHSLALKANGSLWAWGLGRLGNGTTTRSAIPIEIGSGFSAISAGYNHSLALKTDGSLWAWGDNLYGQLGDGTTADSLTPKQIGTDFVAIAAGDSFSVALKADGGLWTWGKNAVGQLGDGTTKNSNTPIQIGSGFSAIAAQGLDCLALKPDGSLWTWGYSRTGYVNGILKSTTPVQIGSDFSAITAGGSHSLALKTDGSLWAWGSNSYGQLGDGSTTSTKTKIPQQVADNFNLGSIPANIPLTLTVTKIGNGTVTSTGINCGTDCSESYTSGSTVTLGASAASGYRFAGWTGDCTVSGDTCSVVMSAARNVTATFTTIDTTPDAFTFEPVSNARRATVITSLPIIVRGIDAPASISISGGEYAINDGAFTAAAGTVKLGSRIRVRLSSPTSFNQTGSATLTIGGVSASFDVTTLDFTPVAVASEVFSNPQTTSVSAQTIQITQAPTTPLQLADNAPDNALVVLATDQPLQVVSAGATLSYTRREADTSFRVQTIGGAKSLAIATGSVDIAATASNVTIPIAGGSSSGAAVITQSADTRLIAGRDQNRNLVLAVTNGPVEYRGLSRNSRRALPNTFTIYPGEAVVTDDEGVPGLLRLGSFAQNQGQSGDYLANVPLANAALKVPVVSGTSQRFNASLSTVVGNALAKHLGLIGSASLSQDSQSGFLTLTVNDQSYRYLPVGDLAIDLSTTRSVNVTEIAANLTQILDQGLSFAVAPALAYTDLESNLKLLDPQSSLEILGDGALLATVGGTGYVAQPAAQLVSGGTGCPKFDSLDGQLALCDASGARQILYPAFADTDNVIDNFQAEIPTLTLQNSGDGAYAATIPGTTLTVTPDIQLTTPPESQAGKLWWQEQDKIFVRYKNDTTQGFSLR